MTLSKRKRYLIDKNLQFYIIGVFLLSIFISLLVFTAFSAGFYWVSGMMGENLFKEYLTIHRQVTEERLVEIDGQQELQEVTATRLIPGVKRWELIVPALLVNNLIILVMVGIIGIIYTNRIAGPLYRVRREVDRILDGEEDVKITIRRRDCLEGLVSRLNKLIDEYYSLKKGSE